MVATFRVNCDRKRHKEDSKGLSCSGSHSKQCVFGCVVLIKLQPYRNCSSSFISFIALMSHSFVSLTIGKTAQQSRCGNVWCQLHLCALNNFTKIHAEM